MILELAKKIFSNKNDRLVGHYRKEIRKINALEEKYQSLSDTELKTAFNTLKQQVQTANNPQSMLNKALYDSFAITREASKEC